MRALRAISLGSIAAATVGVCVFAGTVNADWGDRYHRWHPHDGWDRPWAPPALIVAPRPYGYAPPPAYDAPPPVAYAPPPAYYAPSVSFGWTVR